MRPARAGAAGGGVKPARGASFVPGPERPLGDGRPRAHHRHGARRLGGDLARDRPEEPQDLERLGRRLRRHARGDRAQHPRERHLAGWRADEDVTGEWKFGEWKLELEAELKFDEKGLIPAIVQDDETGQVLMFAWMNEESLGLTRESKQAWFWSRSRKELWHKGATSGSTLDVREIRYDCDEDVLLVKAHPNGPACHTGERSCFFRVLL